MRQYLLHMYQYWPMNMSAVLNYAVQLVTTAHSACDHSLPWVARNVAQGIQTASLQRALPLVQNCLVCRPEVVLGIGVALPAKYLRLFPCLSPGLHLSTSVLGRGVQLCSPSSSRQDWPLLAYHSRGPWRIAAHQVMIQCERVRLAITVCSCRLGNVYWYGKA